MVADFPLKCNAYSSSIRMRFSVDVTMLSTLFSLINCTALSSSNALRISSPASFSFSHSTLTDLPCPFSFFACYNIILFPCMQVNFRHYTDSSLFLKQILISVFLPSEYGTDSFFYVLWITCFFV